MNWSWLYTSSNPHAVAAKARNHGDGSVHNGRLLVDGEELVFEGDTARVAVPLEGVKISRNKIFGGPIQFWHRSESNWTFLTRHTSLFSDPAFDGIATLAASKKRLRLSWYRLRRLTRLLLVLFLVSCIAFPAFRSKVTGFALQFVPVSTEVKFGDEVMQSIARKQPLLHDAEANAALNIIASRITAALPPKDRAYPLKFYLVNDRSVNAYAVPGGHIVVHSGLIEQAGSAEELAGMLAHEVGHVIHRHSFTKMAEMFGTLMIATAVFGDTDNIPNLAFAWTSVSFSRDAENEADKAALTLLESGRVDPQGLIRFFDRQAVEYRRSVGGEMDVWIRMNSTHPNPADRASILRDGVKKFEKGFTPKIIEVDFAGFKRRVGEIAR